MLAVRAVDAEEEVVPPTPTSPSPPSPVIPSIPPHQSPSPPQSQAAEGSSTLGRISVDIDEGIELEVYQKKDAEIEGRQADTQAEIYNIDLDHSSKVVAASTPISAAKPAVKPKVLKFAAAALAVSTRKRKGVSREEMEKEEEEIIKSINETPAQKAAKRRKQNEEAQKQREEAQRLSEEAQKKTDEAQEADDLRGHLEIVPNKDDDVFVEAVPLAQKAPIIDYQVVVMDNKPKYKIIRADDTHQFYISFTTLLKNFDREDLETLWRIVKDRFSIKKPTNFLDEYLLLTLKTMFGELDAQDAIWRNQKSIHGLSLVKRWKMLTSCGVHVIILSTV
nr:hypothetical protein [Tanacetum cinerariifolium]